MLGKSRTVLILATGPESLQTFPQKYMIDDFEVEISLWGLCVKSVLEYSRIVFDLFFNEALISVVVADTSVPKIVNKWEPAEQNCQYLMNGFEKISKELMEPKVQQEDLPSCMSFAADVLCQGKEIYDVCRAVIVLSPERLKVVTNEKDAILTVAASLASRYIKQCRDRSHILEIDIILLSNQDAPCEYLSKVGDWVCRLWRINSAQLPTSFSDFAQQQFGLRWLRVMDIPIKEKKEGGAASNKDDVGTPTPNTSSSGGGGHHVVLLYRPVHGHCGWIGDAGGKGSTGLTTLGMQTVARSLEMRGHWKKGGEKGLVIETLRPKDVCRVTPLDSESKMASCLVKHLKSGKAVVLTNANEVQPQHVIAKTQLGIFLYSLPTTATISSLNLPHVELPEAPRDQMNLLMPFMKELIQSSTIPLSGFEASKPEFADTAVVTPVPHTTMATIERRTRFFPIGKKSTLFRLASAGSIRGLGDFVQCCTGLSSSEKMLAAANECILNVHNAANLPGSGWEEQQLLWTDMVTMANTSGTHPSTPQHVALAKRVQGLVASSAAKRSQGSQQSFQSQRLSKMARRTIEITKDASGQPIMPIRVTTSLIIHSLGTVIYDNPNFHSEKYLWPVGYKASRTYQSMVSASGKTEYLCEIKSERDKPVFQITPLDAPSLMVTAPTASGAWAVILKKTNEIRPEKKCMSTVSGPEYFGLSIPQIKQLIFDLPNASLCSNYRGDDGGGGNIKVTVMDDDVQDIDEPMGDAETPIKDDRDSNDNDVDMDDKTGGDAFALLSSTSATSVFHKYWRYKLRTMDNKEFAGMTSQPNIVTTPIE